MGAPALRSERKPTAGRRPLLHHGEPLHCNWEQELLAGRDGFEIVAGIDEVGRGALCGPVVAAAVILGEGFPSAGLDDSKRLTQRQRERLARRVRSEARAWSIGAADPGEIDRLNILRATHLAMRRAVDGLELTPELLLIDGQEVPGFEQPQRALVKGDARSVSIAAASVIAKQERDGTMREWSKHYPEYGLARNMGYGSRAHMEALRRLGPSKIHRRSFHGTQRWLF